MIYLLGDIVGETFNFNGKGTVNAVSYGKASNGGYVLKDDSHYVKPQMVTKLPERMEAPKGGPIEVVEEVINIKILIYLNSILNLYLRKLENVLKTLNR